MNYHISDESIDRIKKHPAMYTGTTDIWGVHNLIFGFVKDLIIESGQTNFCMEIHTDEFNIFHITCNSPIGERAYFSHKIIETLSSDYAFSVQQDMFRLMFTPDREVFSYDIVEYHSLLSRLTELAQLNKNVKFILTNQENRNVIQFQRGLEVMLMEGIYPFSQMREAKPLCSSFSKNGIEVCVSMIYAYASDVTLSYVNYDKTPDGGTHVEGLCDGLLCAFQEYIQNTDIQFHKNHPAFFLMEKIDGKPYCFDQKPHILGSDVVEGLNFVISLNMSDPVYAGSTRRMLDDEAAYTFIKEGVAESMKTVWESDPSFFYISNVVQKAELRKIMSE